MVTHVFAWEVTTHQQLTRMAMGDIANLNFFVKEFELEKEDYSDQGDVKFYLDDLVWKDHLWTLIRIKESKGKHYLKVAKELTNDNKKLNNIVSLKENYLGIIESCSILEDMGMEQGQIGLDFYLYARFVNHFYDPHLRGCYSLKEKGICAKDWALNGGGDWGLNGGVAKNPNKFSWKIACDYYRDSIRAKDTAKRKSVQADLFASIGFLSHLIQDMTVPAHVRDDFHGFGDTLENWGISHFNTDRQDVQLQSSFDELNLESFDAFFTKTAKFTHDNFFSDDTVIKNLIDDGEEIIDYDEPHRVYSHNSPSLENITEEKIHEDVPVSEEEAEEIVKKQKYQYGLYHILSKGLQVPDGTKLAFSYRSKFYERFSLLLTPRLLPIPTYPEASNQEVLEDYAKILLPRAVSATKGLVNFFFRARVSASIDDNDPDKLHIKNITKKSVISGKADATIEKGSSLYIYYETVDGTRLPLPIENAGSQVYVNRKVDDEYILKKDLANDEILTIEGIAAAVEKASSSEKPEFQRMDNAKRIFIVIDGLMEGSVPDKDRAIAATKLYYKRGLSVTLNWKSEDIEKCSLGLAVIEPDRIPVSSDLYLFWEHFLLYGITYLTDMQMATSLGYVGNNGYAGTSFDKKNDTWETKYNSYSCNLQEGLYEIWTSSSSKCRPSLYVEDEKAGEAEGKMIISTHKEKKSLTLLIQLVGIYKE